MAKELDRRKFLQKSLVTSAGVTVGLSIEEKILLAQVSEKSRTPASENPVKDLPKGKIGNISISRLICGGNLINGYAHSRNLAYVNTLLTHYFTDEKSIETLRTAEENGINTAILNVASSSRVENSMRILNKYWKRGGKIQWIAQCDSYEHDLTTNVKRAIDNGAVGAFIQGGCGDTLVSNGNIDMIGKVVSYMKENGLIAGVGSHILGVPMTVEKTGIEPDFYFKTLNNVKYQCDNLEETVEFMKTVKKPWIAYKVLGAGVIHPKSGFKTAFEMGADFINIGMFDFQIREDVLISRDLLADGLERERSWHG